MSMQFLRMYKRHKFKLCMQMHAVGGCCPSIFSIFFENKTHEKFDFCYTISHDLQKVQISNYAVGGIKNAKKIDF